MDIFDVIMAALLWNAWSDKEENGDDKEPVGKTEMNRNNTEKPCDSSNKDVKKTTKKDPVNHPSHYTDGKYEVIDFIEQYGVPYHLGNAIKYICRAGKKDPNKYIEDLEKALWYIHRWNEKENSEDYAYRRLSSKKTDSRIKYSDFTKDKGLSPQLSQVIFGCISYDDLNHSINRSEKILRKYIDDLKIEQAYINLKKEQAKEILSDFENI